MSFKFLMKTLYFEDKLWIAWNEQNKYILLVTEEEGFSKFVHKEFSWLK